MTKFKETGNRTLRINGDERENERLEENSDYTFFLGCMQNTEKANREMKLGPDGQEDRDFTGKIVEIEAA